MAVAMRSTAGGGDESFRRFEALFAAELDELRAAAREREVSLEAVSEAYFVIVNGDQPMVAATDLRDALGRGWQEAWEIAMVLVDIGEVHLSRETDWWWVLASDFLAELCEKRSIGLKKYMEMRADLASFQDDVVRWYETRQMNGNLQSRTMREIKVDHGRRLQAEYYPGKPFDEEAFHDHQIARYIKTAQDVIVEALDLSY